jgi:Protein of unknown function (DUF3006)
LVSESSLTAVFVRLRQGGRTVKIRLAIDRFEGQGKPIAVLLDDDGAQINFPKRLLPRGSRPGDVLTFLIERDVATTRKVALETRKLQDELKKTDPGGDLRL